MTEEKVTPRGKALVLFAHGKGMVLAWQATESLREMILDSVGCDDSFDLESAPFDVDECEDGLFTCSIKVVDDGPGDWPGSREFVPSFHDFQPATAEEWDHHRKGEWPWEPIEG